MKKFSEQDKYVLALVRTKCEDLTEEIKKLQQMGALTEYEWCELVARQLELKRALVSFDGQMLVANWNSVALDEGVM